MSDQGTKTIIWPVAYKGAYVELETVFHGRDADVVTVAGSDVPTTSIDEIVKTAETFVLPRVAAKPDDATYDTLYRQPWTQAMLAIFANPEHLDTLQDGARVRAFLVGGLTPPPGHELHWSTDKVMVVTAQMR